MSDIGLAEIPVDEEERPLPPPPAPVKNALLDGPILPTLCSLAWPNIMCSRRLVPRISSMVIIGGIINGLSQSIMIFATGSPAKSGAPSMIASRVKLPDGREIRS